MIKIVTVVGARPQFIKASVISRLIRGDYQDRFTEFLVHTGQHYDDNMAGVFFRELGTSQPDINLGIGSATHGKMTGRMLEAVEGVLIDQKPDVVLAYGDTNSTLAGALAASKLHIPVAHVEAGLRSWNMRMPEEQNRVVSDHLSSFLFCPTPTAVQNLRAEGIRAPVVHSGDIMLDALHDFGTGSSENPWELPDRFYLLTLHRPENTDSKPRLKSILNAIREFGDFPAVFPVHPRTAEALKRHEIEIPDTVVCLPPQSYLSMTRIERQCEFVVTDSGGVQKEAYFLRKPCITIRDETEWVETVSANANTVVGSDVDQIAHALRNPPNPESWPPLFGDGTAGRCILNALASL